MNGKIFSYSQRCREYLMITTIEKKSFHVVLFLTLMIVIQSFYINTTGFFHYNLNFLNWLYN